MSCTIKNPSNYDLTDLEPHIQGMYGHFEQKYGFQKPPVMVFDSDPSNQSNVLGKTAYYDPQSLEIHVFIDGRHPKDVLRSIAHELIHHRQNLEGRLDTGGYSGPGYYLENDELKEVEHEAMLDGNATMREYEDTVKYKKIEENKKMSLKEWKNKELNQQLLKKFGILKENKKPDFLDLDGDGDKSEPMADASKDKKGGDDKKGKKAKKGEVPPQLQKHVKGKKDDKEDEKEDLDESTSGRHSDADRRQSKDREYADRLREGDDADENEDNKKKFKNNKNFDNDPKPPKGAPPAQMDPGEEEEKENTLQEAIRRIAKAKKVFLRGKRIK